MPLVHASLIAGQLRRSSSPADSSGMVEFREEPSTPVLVFEHFSEDLRPVDAVLEAREGGTVSEEELKERVAKDTMTATAPDSNEAPVSSASGAQYEMTLYNTADETGASYQLSSQSALGKEEAPRKRRSYNFNEVAMNLQNTAEKALEAKATNSGTKQDSISRSVAQIVLEESNKTVDSSEEYIAGVVQKVAQYAQHGVHDDEASGSSANQVTQPEGFTSLGTMVSFFVIWCVSLCASHMDSKDLPAPALKLGAEEVASVLQSNGSSRSGVA